jgi:hypothetical protein
MLVKNVPGKNEAAKSVSGRAPNSHKNTYYIISIDLNISNAAGTSAVHAQ